MTKNQLYNLFCFIGIVNLEGEKNIFDISPDYFWEKLEKYYAIQPKNEFPLELRNGRYYLDWKLYCEKWKQDITDYRLMNLFLFMREVNFNSFGKISEPKDVFPIFNKYFEEDVSQISNLTYHKAGTHFLIHEWVTKYFKKYDRYIKLLIISDIKPNT